MSSLATGLVSIVPTRRGHFFWAAWWTALPEARPFRRPDASNGREPTRESARAAAERAAGCSLVEIDPRWANAWIRVLRGQDAFVSVTAPTPDLRPLSARPDAQPARGPAPSGSSPWAREVLNVAPGASPDEIRTAFRAAAMKTHPDRGGDDSAFIAAKRAYEVALRAATTPRRRRRRAAR